jgi:hypothetical protein
MRTIEDINREEEARNYPVGLEMTDAQRESIAKNEADMATKGVSYSPLFTKVFKTGDVHLKAEMIRAGRKMNIFFTITPTGALSGKQVQ